MKRLFALAIAALVVAVPGVAQAQHAERGPAGQLPRAPVARSRPDAGPEWERDRGESVTPYVRGDHWYGHAAPNDRRFRLDHPFAHGHFALAGAAHRFRIGRVDLAAHRIWLAGGFGFEIAPWEWSLTTPWCWDCPDDFVVYLDPDHAGWYLLYNVRFGEYVHVQYLGP